MQLVGQISMQFNKLELRHASLALVEVPVSTQNQSLLLRTLENADRLIFITEDAVKNNLVDLAEKEKIERTVRHALNDLLKASRRAQEGFMHALSSSSNHTESSNEIPRKLTSKSEIAEAQFKS